MAFLEELNITGSLGNLSFYKMRGVDKIVVRQKGGAPKEYVKNSPTFKVPRLYMSEFGGCSKMGKEVRFMMHPVRVLSDYNFSGFINKALKIVQKQDGVGELGQRAIMLSKHPDLLAGFQLNKNTMFDSVLRTPITYVLDRKTLSARVNIPALLRDINFHPNNRHARFCIDVSLGIVPDFTFDPGERAYKPSAWYTGMFAPQSVSSPWFPALKGSPATSLEIALTDQVPADDSYSLMLTVGVRYGSPMEDDVVKDVKRAGVAKVIAVAGRPEGGSLNDKQPVKVTTVEAVRGDGEKQPTVSVRSVTACTYGWRSASANQLVESAACSEDQAKAEALLPPENNMANDIQAPRQPETGARVGVPTSRGSATTGIDAPNARTAVVGQGSFVEIDLSLRVQQHHDAPGDGEDG
ncbi:hypothetical protein KK062_23205 [Fulvivirgaceae bacterium PWU5]|uniref:Uncharacterized protein n=1 Tax=Dawidia cretensis TaxID=2782350 RepID=A0AAP2E170_9BACT|nr:hypothetical protein [Dawidia cretensis]MBT1711171.1 hypothetical protein [Dawidia cretensis]